MAQHWFVKVNGTMRGPLTSKQLKMMVEDMVVMPDTEVALNESGPFRPARAVQGLFPEDFEGESDEEDEDYLAPLDGINSAMPSPPAEDVAPTATPVPPQPSSLAPSNASSYVAPSLFPALSTEAKVIRFVTNVLVLLATVVSGYVFLSGLRPVLILAEDRPIVLLQWLVSGILGAISILFVWLAGTATAELLEWFQFMAVRADELVYWERERTKNAARLNAVERG